MASPAFSPVPGGSAPVSSGASTLLGAAPPAASAGEPDQAIQSGMNQVRTLLAGCEGLAQQFPEAAGSLRMAKQALVKATMEIVGSQRGPESPAPRVIA